METKLERITQLSKENPDMVFTSIGHLINMEMLKDCHAKMDKDKAVGIDGVTKEEYGLKLEENLTDLIDRMKRKAITLSPRDASRFLKTMVRPDRSAYTVMRINSCRRPSNGS